VNLEQPATRRRGDELEAAILDAAWAQLVEAGYPGFTYEAIAARAGTSRPVLYRRWSQREELLIAVLKKFWFSQPIEVPDTGSLRDDMLGFLRNADAGRSRIMTMLSVQLMDYFRDSGSSFSQLRDELRGSRPTSGMEQIVARAVARGEAPADLPARVVNLPFDLMRHDMFMTMRAIPEQTRLEIVDEIWLPLLRSYGATRAASADDAPGDGVT
jgi:AcrR family transcriptional regulator